MNKEVKVDQFRFEGYPQSYLDGFGLDDIVVVLRFREHIINQEKLPDAIVVRSTDSGTKIASRYNNCGGQLDLGINWSEPGKYPRDYEEYASTFWGFEGPNNIQTARAEMLAKYLGVPVVREVEVRMGR